MFFLSYINFAVNSQTYYYFFIIMFFLSFFGLINYSRNLVAFMVYLELLYLNISFLFIVISGSLFNMFGELFSFLLLSIAACEAAIGFSILILLLNKQGTIFLNIMYLKLGLEIGPTKITILHFICKEMLI